MSGICYCGQHLIWAATTHGPKSPACPAKEEVDARIQELKLLQPDRSKILLHFLTAMGEWRASHYPDINSIENSEI